VRVDCANAARKTAMSRTDACLSTTVGRRAAAAAVGFVFAVLPRDAAAADAAAPPWWQPDSVYLQLGAAEQAHAAVAGLTWDWDWRHDLGCGVARGHWDVSLGRWAVERERRTSTALVTQVGLTPNLRIESRDAVQPWFFEVGIGLNAVMPLYQSRDKRFSTRLNFGNHVAVGRRYGEHHAHEWALRIEHFSNAGIRHPNPGENFVQLRWARRF
jgi:hypothetical protein